LSKTLKNLNKLPRIQIKLQNNLNKTSKISNKT
jgi:hypothetical protein